MSRTEPAPAAYRVEPCASDDPVLAALLAAAGLPSEDLGAGEQIFRRLREADGGRVLAVGGIELHRPYGLLRSCVVVPEARGRGLGRALVDDLLAEARALDLVRLYLLSETAGDFFARAGFRPVARTDLPAEIAASAQAARLCPESADVMRLDL